MRSRPLLVSVVLLAACAACSDGGSTRPGNAAVYERIDTLTDCSELQREFDVASANFDRGEKGTDQSKIELSYMQAAQARIEELNC